MSFYPVETTTLVCNEIGWSEGLLGVLGVLGAGSFLKIGNGIFVGSGWILPLDREFGLDDVL